MRSSRSEPSSQIIYLRLHAPRQPAFGLACNGCGVCCASEPCPVGRLISGRTRGACSALAWNDRERRYRCALASHPCNFLPVRWRWAGPLLARLAKHFISAGSGCDSSTVSQPG